MSGRTYQTLQKYRGSLYGQGGPPFQGIEYDYEVPDNLVVSSPGGLSNVHHGWQKGFYGNGASTYDLYAGEGNMYPYGELGNLYQRGQNAGTEMGLYPPGTDIMYSGNQSNAHRENYTPMSPVNGYGNGTTPVPGMEMIGAPDSQEAKIVGEQIKSDLKDLTHAIIIPNPWLIMIMFIFIFFAIDFITRAGESIIFTKFHGGKIPEWKWLMLYAAIFMALAIAIGFVMKDPLLGLKKFEGDDGTGR